MYFNMSSSRAQLEEALKILEDNCLTEQVLTSSKWKNSISRFNDLKEKIATAIQERAESDFKIVKMILKCTYRLLLETTTF